MGGKKKKNVANKLAKMSDEERARYMQQRLEIEEEAKRRKEQLIATFMKKKVKKEEAFSRLNLAKINQNWHQILRKAKCTEMKDHIEHLMEWLDRIIAYKNRTIAQLLKDLEDAEEDYLNNFNMHSNHLKLILKDQSVYVDKLHAQYLKDLKALLASAEKDRNDIFKQAEEEQGHLKTILYRQEINDKVVKKEVENCMQKFYEAENEFKSKLQKMLKGRDKICGEIWKETETQIVSYIEKTDAKRLHFVELKLLDADSASEIAQNKERIKQEEEEICTLKEKFARLRSSFELTLSSLNRDLENLKQHFFQVRKNLQRDLENDEKKNRLLVEVSTETIEYLENIAQKGEYIKNLTRSCQKFETEREQIMKWYARTAKYLPTAKEMKPEKKIFLTSTLADGLIDEQYIDDKLPAIEGQKKPELKKSDSLEIETERPLELSPQHTVTETPSPDYIASVQNITLFGKQEETSLPTSDKPQKLETETSGIVSECIKSLKFMENFWVCYNKVKIDCMELKEEKNKLEQENKHLRGMIRAVLEAATLGNSIPNSKVSTRLPSGKVSACPPVLPRLAIH